MLTRFFENLGMKAHLELKSFLNFGGNIIAKSIETASRPLARFRRVSDILISDIVVFGHTSFGHTRFRHTRFGHPSFGHPRFGNPPVVQSKNQK